MTGPAVPEYISVRELYATLDTRDTKIAASIDALKRELLLQFERHEQSHAGEDRRRTSRFRWGIGVALTIGGLAGGFVNHLIERLTG